MRFIAATNRDASTLKHDLLARFPYRVVVPSLRDRRSDIPLLVRDYLARRAVDRPELMAPFFSTGHVLVEPRLVDTLVRHSYSENTRELQRLLEVAITSSPGSFLALTPAVEAELAGRRTSVAETSEAPDAAESSVDIESCTREQIEAALAKAGSVRAAAALLRVSRHALHRYIKRHEIAWQRD